MHKPVKSTLSPFGTCRAHSLARSFFAQKAFYWIILMYLGIKYDPAILCLHLYDLQSVKRVSCARHFYHIWRAVVMETLFIRRMNSTDSEEPLEARAPPWTIKSTSSCLRYHRNSQVSSGNMRAGEIVLCMVRSFTNQRKNNDLLEKIRANVLTLVDCYP